MGCEFCEREQRVQKEDRLPRGLGSRQDGPAGVPGPPHQEAAETETAGRLLLIPSHACGIMRESAPALRKQPGAWQRKWSPMQPDCTTPPPKTCMKCGCTKAHGEFHRNSSTKDGLQ